MKYQVLDTFKVKTSQGEMELQPGQIITLAHDKAIRLLNEDKIKPVRDVIFEKYQSLTDWLQQHDLTADEIKETLPGLYADGAKVCAPFARESGCG